MAKKYSIEQAREETLEYFGGDELATSVFLNKLAQRTQQKLMKMAFRRLRSRQSSLKQQLAQAFRQPI